MICTVKRRTTMNLPNKITLSRILLIPVFAVIFFLDVIPYHYFISAIIFILAACTDFIDGHIARSRNLVLVRQETLTVLWSAEWVLIYAGVCVAVILARELIVSGFRMVAASTGLVLAADKVGKVKTTFQDISIAMLLAGADFFGIMQASRVLNGIGIVTLGIAAVLTIWSGTGYIVKNKAVFKEKQQ